MFESAMTSRATKPSIAVRCDYSTSRADVKNVLQWLRSNDESQSQWEDQTGLLSQAVSDLENIAQARTRPDKTGSPSAESDFFSSEANAIKVAMLDLIEMSMAMELGNREEAIESGEAALALLPERP
jgi:hypothetical protein